MRFHHSRIGPDKYSFVLTEFEPGISRGGPNSPHFDVCSYISLTKPSHFSRKYIAHLESHHLAEQNEAAHTPLDPPSRVSMFPFSLSRFCNRRNSFLKKCSENLLRRGLLGWGMGQYQGKREKLSPQKGKGKAGNHET